MTLKDLKLQFFHELSDNYPSEEVQSFFSILTEYILNYSRLDTVTHAMEVISEEIQSQFQVAIGRLKQYEPIQYITGETEFYGLPIRLNEHTLIPRPETEELIAWILADQQAMFDSSPETKTISILDIGTGSGCIAIALAKNLQGARVSAMDISSEALQMAQTNAILNQVNVELIEIDILVTDKLEQSFDVIVSNPPYVRELEKEMMQSNVLQYEPEGALFVSNEDPLLFYRRIGLLALGHLTPNGSLYFEINEYLGEAIRPLMKDLGFSEIELRKDIFGKDRILRCTV